MFHLAAVVTWGGLLGFPTQLDIFFRRWCQGLIGPQVPYTHPQLATLPNFLTLHQQSVITSIADVWLVFGVRISPTNPKLT